MRSPTGANGYRKAGKWLRGVDLNHRPLGYESNLELHRQSSLERHRRFSRQFIVPEADHKSANGPGRCKHMSSLPLLELAALDENRHTSDKSSNLAPNCADRSLFRVARKVFTTT
jgi:hypothetical protein